jgi:hypothetical protein
MFFYHHFYGFFHLSRRRKRGRSGARLGDIPAAAPYPTPLAVSSLHLSITKHLLLSTTMVTMQTRARIQSESFNLFF